MNKVMYVSNKDINLDVLENEEVEIYNYIVDSSSNITINLKGNNAKLIYHYSIISKNDKSKECFSKQYQHVLSTRKNT